MPFRVSGRNLDIGEALREHVNTRIEVATTKYFNGSVNGHVVITPDGSGYLSDCTLHLASGITLQADGRAHEPYASFDQAAERIEKRLRRYKRRLKGRATARTETANERSADAQSYVIAAPDHETEEEVAAFSPVIIAESTTMLERLSVSEAVLELDMTGAPVVVFRHCVNGRVNIVYRRGDGNVGWVDPPAANGQG